ncbi:hypothetical protein TSUD_240930 [Trifolium subterraneum]|uniref:Uncharacterized protein n=1 Tax=Trifolium subterraneum TaxID=3900 RepID=A0A2Z6NKX6_TRISU|nr:hypothetical protein TSUD_240930 [Trifolium subterraneum]
MRQEWFHTYSLQNCSNNISRTELVQRWENPSQVEDEDEYHILFASEASKEYWERADWMRVLQQCLQNYASVKEVIMDICSREEQNVAGHVAMVIIGQVA